MKYAVWNDGSKLVAGNLCKVGKVRDLLIPDGAVLVTADTEEEAVNRVTAEGAGAAGLASVSMDAVNEANLDLGFIHAFVDMLFKIDTDRGLDELHSGTVSAMCHEALEKIGNLEGFIEAAAKGAGKIEAKTAA